MSQKIIFVVVEVSIETLNIKGKNRNSFYKYSKNINSNYIKKKKAMD